MALVVVLDSHADGVLISGSELNELITNLDLYRSKFEDLLRVAILAYASATRSHDGAQPLQSIEEWVYNNYLEIREHLPPDLKRLYLHEMAFRPR